MKPIIRITVALALTLGLTVSALAQADSISGEVKKVDEGAGKITLKHGPSKSLGMDEGMTMVYRVKDPAMLKQVKVGDTVTFEAEGGDIGLHGDQAAEGQVATPTTHPAPCVWAQFRNPPARSVSIDPGRGFKHQEAPSKGLIFSLRPPCF